MKKSLLFVAAIAVSLSLFAQSNPAGTWEGKLNVGPTSLRIVLHLTKTADGYTATMDSPDQGAVGIPTSSAKVSGDSVVVEIAAIGGQYAGRLATDSALNGQWKQGAAAFPLQLKKVATASVLKRPQTPQPPFSYLSEDTVFTNAGKTIRYGATITVPHKKMGPFPAAVLISGSGYQNRDEELFGHKPFAVIADYLTGRGYVVLRIDDRGVDQSTGPVQGATSKDFADDVKAAMDYLKTYPGVNPKAIGLIGHSEGGMIAQLVAADRPDVAFIISLAGPGQPIADLMVDQNRAIMKTAGIGDTAINDYLKLYRRILPVVANAPTEVAARAGVRDALRQWWQTTPAATVKQTTGISDSTDGEAFVVEIVGQLRSPWFQYFLQYNPGPVIRKIKVPVLALNGDRDVQVVAGPNLDGWRTWLSKSSAKGWEVKELLGLNHLFQRCTTCTVAEYAQLEETFSPEALKLMGEWLGKTVK